LAGHDSAKKGNKFCKTIDADDLILFRRNLAKKKVKEYAVFFDEANVYLKTISRTRFSTENEDFLHELSETLDIILKHFGDTVGNDTKVKGLKKSLDALSSHVANISLSIQSGGHLNPKNDIAGNIKEFKGKFDAFVAAFLKISENHKTVLTSVAIEELLRKITHFS